MLSQGHHRLEAGLCWCNISQLKPVDSVKANINPPVQEGVVGIANDAFGKPSRRQLSYMGCCEWVWSNIKIWSSLISACVSTLTKLTMFIQIRPQTASNINKYHHERVLFLRSFFSWIPPSILSIFVFISWLVFTWFHLMTEHQVLKLVSFIYLEAQANYITFLYLRFSLLKGGKLVVPIFWDFG